MFTLLVPAVAPAAPPELKLPIVAPPSQVSWIPTLIKAQGLDLKHGFSLTVEPKPSNIAFAEFASGAIPVCYCIAIAAGARFVQQGADVTLLWNIFDFGDQILTADPSIRALGDLRGRSLQADTGTGAWVITQWFLQRQGIAAADLSVKSSVNRGTAALAELELGRVDAALLNPAAIASARLASKKALHTVPVFDAPTWRQYAGQDSMPTITFAVQRSWYADPANQDLARRLYAASLEAAELIKTQPRLAAQQVAAATGAAEAALVEVFEQAAPQLINISPVAQHKETIRKITQDLLPATGQLPRPLTDAEVDRYVSDFAPQ